MAAALALREHRLFVMSGFAEQPASWSRLELPDP